jgi:hypothetical protein
MLAMLFHLRAVLFFLCLAIASPAWPGAEVFQIQSSYPEEVAETLRAALGERAQVSVVQQKLVVVGDDKTVAEARALLRQIDRLPANLRLTLTETPPREGIDADSGVITYQVDKSTQVLETVEGARVSLEFTKFHQQPVTDGWMFAVNEQPVAVQQLEMNVRLIGVRTLKVMLSFVRHENQQRKVYGRIVTGELGEWIPLLTESSVSISEGDGVEYRSGAKPGEQLYLRVEKVFAPRKIGP